MKETTEIKSTSIHRGFPNTNPMTSRSATIKEIIETSKHSEDKTTDIPDHHLVSTIS